MMTEVNTHFLIKKSKQNTQFFCRIVSDGRQDCFLIRFFW